jgi:hypothetical protein
MGACGQKQHAAKTSPVAQSDSFQKGPRTGVWKVLPSAAEAKEKYEAEGTLTKAMDSNHLELRTLLDDPVAQHVLGAYAKESHAYESFMFWIDIQEFKSIPTDDYRRSKANHIFQKYIKRGAVLEYGGIEDSDRMKYEELLEQSRHDKSILHSRFYDKVSTLFLQTCNTYFQLSVYNRSS